MPALRRALLSAGSLLILAAAPAVAQDHTIAAGYGAGFVSLGRLNPGVEGTTLTMDPGWVVTAFGETWHEAGGRVGTRVNAAFTQRPLEIAEEVRNINTWMLDASVLLRLLPPREGGMVALFASAGGGLIHYGFRTGPAAPYPAEGVVYQGDDQLQLTLVGGGGFDIVPARLLVFGNPIGLRFEAADHVAFRSPFEGIDGGRLGPIHNVRLGVSLIGLGWF